MHLRLARCIALSGVLGLGFASAGAAHAQDDATNTSPSRADIADYFSIRADLYTCGRGWHGSVDVAVTFSSDGLATNVELTASAGTLPEGIRSCVASVLRAARIRAFADPSAVVRRTIRL